MYSVYKKESSKPPSEATGLTKITSKKQKRTKIICIIIPINNL
jgi:hypothetical protein